MIAKPNDRRLPQDVESEKGLLACIFLNPETMDEIAAIVRPDDFLLHENRAIYAHAVALHAAGKHPDNTLMIASLRKAREFDEGTSLHSAGGVSYLCSLFDREPTASNAVYYARIVRETSVLRGLIQLCESIANRAYDVGIDCDELLASAEEAIFSLADNGREETLRDVRDILQQAMSLLSVDSCVPKVSSISTGYPDLDSKLGGLFPGQLIIVAGRPSMGKTALAANIIERVSLDQGVPAVLFSVEMSDLEIANRMLFCRAKVSAHRGRNGTLSQVDIQNLVKVQGEYAAARLHIDQSANPTVNQMASACRRLKRKSGLGLVVVDYLQLIAPDSNRDPRQEQVAGISRKLKRMAKELNVPVICVAQLNRQTEAVSDHRPRLSHLRESGAIEQDADVVLFCHREEYYAQNESEKDKVRGQAEVIIAKQRNGPTGSVPLSWLEDFMRFESAYKPSRETPNQYNARTNTPRRGKDFDPDEWE